MYEELKARLRDLIADNNWAGNHIAVPSLEAIEQLERQLAEHQSWFETVRNELDKTKVFANVQASAATHWIEKHDAIEAQFAKYRDAPVICSQYQDLWGNWCLFLDEKHEVFVRKSGEIPVRALIVKPGE